MNEDIIAKTDWKGLFNWRNILYIALILAVIGMCVYVIFWLNGHGFQCMKDPIAYAQKISNQTCLCMSKFP